MRDIILLMEINALPLKKDCRRCNICKFPSGSFRKIPWRQTAFDSFERLYIIRLTFIPWGFYFIIISILSFSCCVGVLLSLCVFYVYIVCAVIRSIDCTAVVFQMMDVPIKPGIVTFDPPTLATAEMTKLCFLILHLELTSLGLIDISGVVLHRMEYIYYCVWIFHYRYVLTQKW